MSTKEKQPKGSAKSSASKYSKVYHKKAAQSSTSLPARYVVKKPPLYELLEKAPSDWFDLSTLIVNNTDNIYTVKALMTSIFVDDETDKGVLYLRLPSAPEDYDEEYKDSAWLQLLAFESVHIPREEALIGVPWNVYHNVINLKVTTANKIKASQVFERLRSGEGWMKDVEIVVSFKLSPYTDFPEKGKHGISCKLQGAPHLLHSYDEATQDPEHPYFTGN